MIFLLQLIGAICNICKWCAYGTGAVLIGLWAHQFLATPLVLNPDQLFDTVLVYFLWSIFGLLTTFVAFIAIASSMGLKRYRVRQRNDR